MNLDVRNCKSCGRLFQYNGNPNCPECLKSKDDDFTVVRDYVRKHPNAGVAEVSEETNVSMKQIRQWIREERLILTEVSAEMGINCEGCGRPIRTGRLCPSCKTQMNRDLKQAFVKAPEQDNSLGLNSNGDRMRYLSKNKLEK